MLDSVLLKLGKKASAKEAAKAVSNHYLAYKAAKEAIGTEESAYLEDLFFGVATPTQTEKVILNETKVEEKKEVTKEAKKTTSGSAYKKTGKVAEPLELTEEEKATALEDQELNLDDELDLSLDEEVVEKKTTKKAETKKTENKKADTKKTETKKAEKVVDDVLGEEDSEFSLEDFQIDDEEDGDIEFSLED